MPRRVLLLGLAVVTLGGCGGGEERAPTETERVRATVAAFRDATAARDYERLCSRLLAPALTRRLARAGFPCPEALARFLGATRAPELRVLGVRVRGDRAEAGVQTSARGQAPVEGSLGLVRVRGGWRIASLSATERPR